MRNESSPDTQTADLSVGPERRRILVAGASGALGREVLGRLVGSRRYAQVRMLTKHADTDGLRGVTTERVAGDDIAQWPMNSADAAVVMFEPSDVTDAQERAAWTPAPAQLVALATWLRHCGVQTLVVVLPHARATIPEALKHGLAGLDEQAIAALGFERLLFIRSAQMPVERAGQGMLEGLASYMLSIVKFMVPASEQPVRPARLAEFLDMALQLATPGIHVAAPDLVWRAAQGDMRATVTQWLAR